MRVAADREGTHGSLGPIDAAGLRQQICDRLREAIWDGGLAAGSRLNEQQVADQMGVSRPPLREAIRVLEQEGLIESVPRRGAFVRMFTSQDISEIYAVRCALEGMAAELAMAAATDEIGALEEQIVRIKQAERVDLRAAIALDFEFHRSLVRLSGNSRLALLWEQVAGQLRLAITLVDPAFFQAGYVESTHGALINAIRRRDRGESVRLTRMLLDVGRSLGDRWDDEATKFRVLKEGNTTSPSTPAAPFWARSEHGNNA